MKSLLDGSAFRKNVRTFLACLVAGGAVYALTLWALHAAYAGPKLDNLVTCFQPTDDITFSSHCLQKNVGTLLTAYSPADILSYIVGEGTPASVKNMCHPIGHVIGIATYAKAGSLEKALSMCTSDCQSACTHGAIGAAVLQLTGAEYPDSIDFAHADIAELKKLAVKYCANAGLCHAIGHLSYLAEGNVLGALRICDATSAGFPREACYHGVYMEKTGFSERILPYSTLATSTSQDVYDTRDCSAIAPQYRHACFIYYLKYPPTTSETDAATGAERLERFKAKCEVLDEPDRASCFEGIAVQSVSFGLRLVQLNDETKMQRFCDQFDTFTDRTSCSIGTVIRYLFFKNGEMLRYCHNIGESKRRDICYTTAFQYLEGIYNSNDVSDLCMNLPECTREYADYKAHESTVPDYRFGLYGDTAYPTAQKGAPGD